MLAHELADRPDLKEYLDVITHEAVRLQQLLDRLLAPNRKHILGEVNIHEVLERVRKASGLGPNGEMVDPQVQALQQQIAELNTQLQAAQSAHQGQAEMTRLLESQAAQERELSRRAQEEAAVYQELADEIIELVGQEPYDWFVAHVEARPSTHVVPHPARRR